MKKAVIFDLDGTLIDSYKDIALHMNDALKELKLPTNKLEAYSKLLGDGALYLAQNAVPKNSSKELIEAVLAKYQELYAKEIYSFTKPYEGVYKLLEELQKQNFGLAILSNKPHFFTQKYAKMFFSQFNFSQVVGQKEDSYKKPNPQAALEIASYFNLDTKDIFFVGDTPTDIKTAINANMQSIGVLWGFRTKKDLLDAKADYLVNSPLDILSIIK